jgi:Lrp/AsnC family transcriptional regulator
LEEFSLDATDRKILRELQQQPDITIADLGTAVGLSQTPCWRRLRRLQDSGTVARRIWLLNPVSLGLSVNVFAEVRLKQHDEETLLQFEARTSECSDIVECFSMSGKSDYLLRILVGSVADYEALLKKTLLHLPGVGSINSSFALKAVKVSIKLPI